MELISEGADDHHINNGDMIMELKFVAAQKPKTQNPITQRRQRLVDRIDQQIALLSEATAGTLPSKSWVWVDDNGAYFLSIKYGRLVVELKKGMFAVQCADLNQALEAIEHLKAMVKSGDLDPQITQASNKIRSNFKSA